jgi:hypothetical protein
LFFPRVAFSFDRSPPRDRHSDDRKGEPVLSEAEGKNLNDVSHKVSLRFFAPLRMTDVYTEAESNPAMHK